MICVGFYGNFSWNLNGDSLIHIWLKKLILVFLCHHTDSRFALFGLSSGFLGQDFWRSCLTLQRFRNPTPWGAVIVQTVGTRTFETKLCWPKGEENACRTKWKLQPRTRHKHLHPSQFKRQHKHVSRQWKQFRWTTEWPVLLRASQHS